MIDTSTLADAIVIAVVASDKVLTQHRASKGRRKDALIESRLDRISNRLENVEELQKMTESKLEAIFRILASVMQKRGERSVK